DDGDERAADVEEEDDAYERHDGALLDERPLERVDGAVDQVGAVVDRLDRDALGQAWRDLGEAALDAVDDRQGVLAEPLQSDAGNDLALAVEFADAAPLVGSELHARDVAQQHRHAAIALDDDLLQVGQA